MKKMLVFVASVATAIALTSCGCSKGKSGEAEKEAAESAGSAKGVAERFVTAIVQRNLDAAWALYDPAEPMSKARARSAKEAIERLGKDINDDKLEGKSIREVIRGGDGYKIVNGKKYTDQARVVVQFVKGKDKKPDGMKVELVAVDGSWKVRSFDLTSGLDTSDDENETAPKPARRAVSTAAASSVTYSRREAKAATKASAYDVAKKAETKYDMPVAMPATKAVAAEKKFEKADYGSSSKVREFENACHELARLARQSGEKVDESEVQKEIDKFKTLSSSEQDKQLKQVKEVLELIKSPKK